MLVGVVREDRHFPQDELGAPGTQNPPAALTCDVTALHRQTLYMD
jgi:hypothetical protein